MMAGKIMLSAAQLAAKKTKLEMLNAKFALECAKLDLNAAQLDASWDGDAADAFKAGYKKDKESYTKFNNLVKNYTETLETIIKNYEAAEKKNLATIKKR